jgi:hypothetical protein
MATGFVELLEKKTFDTVGTYFGGREETIEVSQYREAYIQVDGSGVTGTVNVNFQTSLLMEEDHFKDLSGTALGFTSNGVQEMRVVPSASQMLGRYLRWKVEVTTSSQATLRIHVLLR